MTYKKLNSITNGSINYYAKIDDDGISRSSCSEHNPEFQAWLAEGNEPLPADPVEGNEPLPADEPPTE